MTAVVQEVSHSGTGELSSAGAVIAKPASLAVGNLMVATCYLGNNTGTGPPTAPTGWTAIYTIVHALNGYMQSWWKIADSTDVSAASFTFSDPTGTDYATGVIQRITGHDPTTPIGTVGAQTVANTNPNATYGPITPNASGGLVLKASAMRTNLTLDTYGVDSTLDLNYVGRTAGNGAVATVGHLNAATVAGTQITPDPDGWNLSGYSVSTGLVVIKPAAPPAATANIRVNGTWTDVPRQIRVGGSWT